MSKREREHHDTDRRMHTRYAIQAPAIVTLGKREVWALTRDLSTRSVYLRVPAEEAVPVIGDLIDCLIRIPPTMLSTGPCFIHGRGRIIRTECAAWGDTGVVAEICDFEIQTGAAVPDADGYFRPKSTSN